MKLLFEIWDLVIDYFWQLVKICLLIVICLLIIIVPHARASTTPISATSSATATIPATTGTTSANASPTTPILIYPTDGTVTGDNQTELIWHQSSDPDGNFISYTLYLNGVATYLGISNDGNSAGSGYTGHLDGNQVKLKPSLALPDGPYDWYVSATDSSGNTSYSTTWHFTIDSVAPYIQITDIDTYHHLELDNSHPGAFQDLNFDIAGPKDVYLTVYSEPWSTLTIKFLSQAGELVSQSSYPLNQAGLAYPSSHLAVGTYSVIISSFDQGGNTTTLPPFQLTITQSSIQIQIPSIPGVTQVPPTYTIPYTPLSLPSLPATIAKLSTTYNLSTITYIMLAVMLLLLLIFIWNHKPNLILLNVQGLPLTNTKVYHSIPTSKAHFSPIYLTKLLPISYNLISSDRGRLYIKHLNRYSTLTIITPQTTYILSLSAKRSLYTLILG